MNTSYSLNRGTINESLNESLIDARSNTVVSQKVERSTSKKDGALGRSGTISTSKSIADMSRKNDKFNEQNDLRTVLENFLSQPTQFKYNRD
jgi:hypothetical protein